MASGRIRVPRTIGRPDTLPGTRSISSQPIQSMSESALTLPVSRLLMLYSLFILTAYHGVGGIFAWLAPGRTKAAGTILGGAAPSRGPDTPHTRPSP